LSTTQLEPTNSASAVPENVISIRRRKRKRLDVRSWQHVAKNKRRQLVAGEKKRTLENKTMQLNWNENWPNHVRF